MRRAETAIGLLACGAVSVTALPLDTLLSHPGADSSRSGVEIGRETGRDRARWHLVQVDSLAGGIGRAFDTAGARSNERGIWSGDAFLSGSWSRDSLDLGWRMWERTSGLGAPDAAQSDHAWLQQALVRLRAPSFWGVHLGVAGGALVERQDPGSSTLALDPSGPPAGRLSSAGLLGAELAWERGGDIPATFEALALESPGNGTLLLSRRGASGSVAASVSGDGTDSLRLWASWDSLRLRSLELSADRSEDSRWTGASWTLRAGRQTWTASGSWTDGGKRDRTGRSQGQDLTGWYGDVDVQGPLGGGWTHRQRLSRTQERRDWHSPGSGDPYADSILSDQDRRDGDLVRVLLLSDTLRWSTPDAGGWNFWAGLAQSLRQTRHPANASPTSLDRPDEDLSRRMLTLSASSPTWASPDRPLASWTGSIQQDVFPLAVQSISTSHRVENRFSVDLDPSLADLRRWVGLASDSGLLRPVGGIWGREQRNSWRFDSSRSEGLLEEGWWAGLEAGPKSEPWLQLRWKRWTVWTGALPGDCFAPDRIQDDWMLEMSGAWPVPPTGIVWIPWLKEQIERIRAWDGSGWTALMRSTSGQAGMDLSWAWTGGSLRAGAGREWSTPGWSGWKGSMQAGVRW